MRNLLRNRSLVAILAAELVSFTGTSMTGVALPWFVLVTTGSTARMGLVLAAGMLPVTLFGFLSGSLIGRFGARWTMNIADAGRFPLLALIPILQWTGHLTLPLLLVLSFLIGCFTTPYFPSAQLILPEVLGDDEQLVAQGSAFLNAVKTPTTFIGPALAGLLIAWRGAPSVLLIDAATYLFSFIVILLFVRAGQRIAPTDQSRGVLAGVRFLIHDPLLGPASACMAALNGIGQGIAVSLPALAFRRYNHDPHLAGLFVSSMGIGFLLGTIIMGHVAQRFQLPRIAAVAIIAASCPLWVLAIPLPWPVVAILIGAYGVCTPLVLIPMNTLLVLRAPEELRPKVISAAVTIGFIAMPLGVLVFGEVLQYTGLSQTFLIIATLFTAAALLFALAIRRNEATQTQPNVKAVL